MKKKIGLSILPLLFGICPIMISCGKKSGVETENATDTSAVRNSPAGNKANATVWIIDANASEINFTIRNMGMDVNGTLGGLKGTIAFDENNLEGSAFETAVEVNTINTGIDRRDKDLMAEKFFDQEKYKQIVFRSDSIMKKGNSYEVAGNFTIKGISQHRTLPFTFEQTGDKAVFKSSFTLNRLDFGVGGDGPVMDTDVKVSLKVVVNKE